MNSMEAKKLLITEVARNVEFITNMEQENLVQKADIQ